MASQVIATPFLAVPREPVAPRARSGATGRQGGSLPRRFSLWASVQAAYRRHRSRAALARFDAHQLKDIGISWSEAEFEANKPFWRR